MFNNSNEVRIARILKHVTNMNQTSYEIFMRNRVKECQKGKISFEWLRAFKDTCDILRGPRG